MKRFVIVGIFIVVILQACSQEREKTLVARNDYEVSSDWQPRQFMGKDFWFMHMQEYPMFYMDGSNPMMRELKEKPLFNESGVVYTVMSINPSGSEKVSISGLPDVYHQQIEKQPRTPFFIMPFDIRPVQRLMKDFEHDMETYNRWKDAHPNFMGWIHPEVDTDFFRAITWRKNTDQWEAILAEGDQELIETILREFPKPQNRKEVTQQFMKGLEANRKYFFNDTRNADNMRAGYCVDHYFLESGSDVTVLETTNTAGGEEGGHYRHQVSLFFTRGAARQYNKNWLWYVATFYNGYDDLGNFSGDNASNYLREEIVQYPDGSYGGPGVGMSASLLKRDLFLSYLSGTSFVSAEHAVQYFHKSEKDGEPIWDLSSPFGKAWEDWFEFTRKNPDRGISYAPVALLVPFEQGYPNYGGESWGMFNYERSDWMIDAFMFSIVPHSPVTKKGNEGALVNSPFGDIYDVITPNTPQKPVSLEVLSKYKVAVMLGEYAKDKALSERAMEYVKNGGTLLLNINQINEFFPADFLGFERTAAPDNLRDKYDVKGPVRSLSDGKSFELSEEYEMEAINLKRATPLLEDAEGKVLACLNRYGKGNLIVATVDYLLPKTNIVEWKDGVYGKTFPFVGYFLENFVKEVLPLEVKGDIQYGLNKLSDGWLLYLINNKGVTKLTNKEQILDNAKTAQVEVSLKDIRISKITELREQRAVSKDDKNNSFTIDVPPGDIRVVKIEGKF